MYSRAIPWTERRRCNYRAADYPAPKEDMHALWRRIVFSILISNTDDHLRNHGFLWAGPSGWRLPPAYDRNPVPTDIKPRVLTTTIDLDDGTASLKLALQVASYFELAECLWEQIPKTSFFSTAVARRHPFATGLQGGHQAPRRTAQPREASRGGIGAVEREAGAARGRAANRHHDHLRGRAGPEDRMNADFPEKLRCLPPNAGESTHRRRALVDV